MRRPILETSRRRRAQVALIALWLVATPLTAPVRPEAAAGSAQPKQRLDEIEKADDLLLVDCLLPGRVRRLGRRQTYVTRRRPVRISAVECEIRGGEYTAHDRANLRSALGVWLESARSGDAQAQTWVGEIFEKGLGVPPDFEAAAIWYRKAADQGHAGAQVNLGQLYETGRGVERDVVEALGWYRRAAGLPGSIAIDTLGLVSEPGASRNRSELQTEAVAQQLAAAEAAADRANAAQQATEQRAARDLAAQSSEFDALRDDYEARIADLERALAAARDQGRSLRETLDARREASEAFPSARELAAPPVIEMIDPPLLATRGVQLVQAVGATRLLIGRVTAAGGLFSFLVDGTPTTIEPSGLFRAEVPIADAPRTVRLVAVDEMGQRSAFELDVAAMDPPKRKPEPPERLRLGRYVALVVGNDSYQHLPDLQMASRDARAIEKVLRARFGFETTLLIDADRYAMLSALNTLRTELSERDNLLIYYAGHGELEASIQRGYWLPVDAERSSPANWISVSTITDYLSVVPAKHALVIADSCYSGALTRSAMARLEDGVSPEARRQWLETVAEKRSRTALSSGGLAPVLDAGGGGHSVFASAVLRALRDVDGVLEARRLFLQVSQHVNNTSTALGLEQTPEYAPIHFAGHEGGDFLFAPAALQRR